MPSPKKSHVPLLPQLTQFPPNARIEPTDEWTIEQLLHWCLLQGERRTNERRDELISALREQLEEGKKVLMEAHEQAVQASAAEDGGADDEVVDGGTAGAATASATNGGEKSTGTDDDVEVVGVVPAGGRGVGEENVQPADSSAAASAKPSAAAAAKPKAKTTKAAGTSTVYAEIIDGLYAGQTFELQPKPRSPCFIGRSAGKKFRDRGISMPQDGEVSTTHGKVEVKAGKAYYTDVGSTNGTLLDGEELEANVPLLITDGMKLLIGAETIKFTLG